MAGVRGYGMFEMFIRGLGEWVGGNLEYREEVLIGI